MKISKLKINKFRHLSDIDLKIGNNLTAIAGQNGIGKSSILGLLGHVCRDNSPNKTLFSNGFATEYSEIFKLDFPDFDKEKEHSYEVHFDSGETVFCNSLERRSTAARSKTLRIRTYQIVNGKKKEVKVDHPVIYLGLKRLFPIAQEIDKKITKSASYLSGSDVEFYQKNYNQILLKSDEIEIQNVSSPNKKGHFAKTKVHGFLGNSAGQDNISQIINSILSFRKLKEALGTKYQGGLLLIDEIDATLFDASLEKLIDFLARYSDKLDLQVVFTTHSMNLLKRAIKNLNKQSQILYFFKSRGLVKIHENPTIDLINQDLNLLCETKKLNIHHKVKVYTEDKEAELFIKNLLDKDFLKKINIEKISLGCTNYLNLLDKGFTELKQNIVVLDGDAKKDIKKNKYKFENIVLLPRDVRPEDVIYDYLKLLDDNSSFWGDDLGGYDKQKCFRNLNQKVNDRDRMKKWFREQLESGGWGKNAGNLFKYWKIDNSELVKKFNVDFKKVFDLKS